MENLVIDTFNSNNLEVNSFEENLEVNLAVLSANLLLDELSKSESI